MGFEYTPVSPGVRKEEPMSWAQFPVSSKVLLPGVMEAKPV